MTLDGPFSAESNPISVIQATFSSIRRDLQDALQDYTLFKTFFSFPHHFTDLRTKQYGKQLSNSSFKSYFLSFCFDHIFHVEHLTLKIIFPLLLLPTFVCSRLSIAFSTDTAFSISKYSRLIEICLISIWVQ